MTPRLLFMPIAAIALMSSRAAADEHHMRVSEVFLADLSQGDAVQFVELIDPVDEPFPADYQLGIYDPAGALVDTVPVDPPPGTTRYLVATSAAETAFGVAADAPLSATLPGAGQICFEAMEEGQTETIACLAYGCVDQVVDAEFANEISMAPLVGMSVQRQEGSDRFEMAEPTPGSANVAGVSGEPDCNPADDEQDDDDGGCQVASTGSPGGLALVVLGLLAVRRTRRRTR